jgi:hypothetical protein
MIMTKKERINKFSNFLSELNKAGWRDSDRLIQENISSLDEKTFDDVFFGDKVYQNLMNKAGLNTWMADKFLLAALYKYNHKSDRILKECSIYRARELVLSRGLYSDVSVLDYVARNDEGEVQYVAAQFCSVEALRDIVDAKLVKVRKVVFQRLGPVECLDLMLSDKMAEIREDGVRAAPVGYKKLNDMTKEIARGPFSELVGKISSEYLPMLLANRNLKNKWVSKMLEGRLSTEENNDV